MTENVGLDGNYSIQVISTALKACGNLWLESIDSEENRKKDHYFENAIICHTDAHWVAVRKVNNKWFN